MPELQVDEPLEVDAQDEPTSGARARRAPTDRPLDSWRAHLREWHHDAGAAVLGRLTPRAVRWQWVKHLPALPFRRPAVPAPWAPTDQWQTPETLRTVAGAQVDPVEQERVRREGPPFWDFFALYPEAGRLMQRFGWQWMLPSLRIFRHWVAQIDATKALVVPPETRPTDRDAQALTDAIRAEGLRLGLSAIGFASYDPRYTFVAVPPMESGPVHEGTVIVCVLEQDWAATQTIPSVRSERSTMKTYLRLATMVRQLAEFLHERGIESRLYGPDRLAVIPYAVQAGLGQLGLNGQLLTPAAGSRARIFVLTTDAELVPDQPVDFGIHAICDACQLCVKRCPPGAIPNRRASYRGVIKAKIKPDRCMPVIAQAHGCAICMKVCPVQRYGLRTVTDHLLETGEILGKGTDELEGYRWIDGRHYGPGQKPRMTKELMRPLGVVLEANRTVPPPRTTNDEVEHVVV